MKRRHLNIFVSVYEHLNMTAAAEDLYISQPSVSQVIKELEQYYQVRLFERYPKSLFPTAEGELLYKYAKQILGLFDEAEKEIRYISERATITVGANISVGTVLMRRYIDRFAEKYPSIRVDVRVAGSARLSKMIFDHQIDFALMEDLVRETNLVQIPFYHDRIVLTAAPDHPKAKKKHLRLEDFAGEQMLLRDRGAGVRDKFDQLMNLRGIQIEPAWQASNTGSLINAAAAGYGVAVLPYLLVKEKLDSGELVMLDVKDKDLKRDLNITYHKEKIFNKWVEEFIDVIKNDELSFTR